MLRRSRSRGRPSRRRAGSNGDVRLADCNEHGTAKAPQSIAAQAGRDHGHVHDDGSPSPERRDACCDRVGVGDVEWRNLDTVCGPIAAPKHCGGVFELGPVAPVDDDACAGGTQSPRDREPEPAAATGDERQSPRQIERVRQGRCAISRGRARPACRTRPATFRHGVRRQSGRRAVHPARTSRGTMPCVRVRRARRSRRISPCGHR